VTAEGGGRIALLVGLFAGTLTGCSASAVTAERVQSAVGATFANLYVHQQDLLGHSGLSTEWVSDRASCLRRGADPPDRGPGDDWECQLGWRAGDGSPQQATYEVQVRTNGCFTATGSQPVAGKQVLRTSRGRLRINPIYQFDGCFDPS